MPSSGAHRARCCISGRFSSSCIPYMIAVQTASSGGGSHHLLHPCQSPSARRRWPRGRRCRETIGSSGRQPSLGLGMPSVELGWRSIRGCPPHSRSDDGRIAAWIQIGSPSAPEPAQAHSVMATRHCPLVGLDEFVGLPTRLPAQPSAIYRWQRSDGGGATWQEGTAQACCEAIKPRCCK